MNQQTSLYKSALLQHFKQPRNKQQGPFEPDVLTARGSIPLCGDDIEVGVKFEGADDSVASKVGFRGRGCSVCLASASMMTEAVEQLSSEQMLALAKLMQKWVNKELEDDTQIPDVLMPLSAVKDHPARKKCVMLSWNALTEVTMRHRSHAE